LPTFAAPVLAVAGELDISDVAKTAVHLQDHAPDARAVVLPGVAHLVGMECPETLANLVVEFMSSLS
jgi:pimeloyl-ACP methyl ester carboxylesterase